MVTGTTPVIKQTIDKCIRNISMHIITSEYKDHSR